MSKDHEKTKKTITTKKQKTKQNITTKNKEKIMKKKNKCDAKQRKVHKVVKQNFSREMFIENEVKMIKIVFLQIIVGRDI